MPAAPEEGGKSCVGCGRQAGEEEYCHSCRRFRIDERDKNGVASFLHPEEKERILRWRAMMEFEQRQETAWRTALDRR